MYKERYFYLLKSIYFSVSEKSNAKDWNCVEIAWTHSTGFLYTIP